MHLEYNILLGNLGGLSLTSVRVMFTVVVPASPPSCPPMSLAWIRTWYCSFTSLSIFGKAVLITPKRRNGKQKEQVNKGLWLSTITFYYWISWTRNGALPKGLIREEFTQKHANHLGFSKVCSSAVPPFKMTAMSFQSGHGWLKENGAFSLGMWMVWAHISNIGAKECFIVQSRGT